MASAAPGAPKLPKAASVGPGPILPLPIFTKYLEDWLEVALKALLSSKKAQVVIQPIPPPNPDRTFDDRFKEIFSTDVKSQVNASALTYDGLSESLKLLRDIFDLPFVEFTGSTFNRTPDGNFLVAKFFSWPIVSIPEHPIHKIEVAVITTISLGDFFIPKVIDANFVSSYDILPGPVLTEKTA
ncbi:hypothetical protein SISNIDRAFT_498318 [Sistotremastrum niveocremeum HHB9708]|uniref:Uncharacterized protein n=2 Tax=Sistotremastraceae TaxID=3402574 RepID=A0A164NGH0_9AGAM|nr:hypothetical protein SISNIDRAFT_498318 [Sistotremastrum niveocremeum HHB9708]KZT33126.1 hypothetical protein SISSUDRAFT_1132745 [Sistotremastrum suecicum HHB10207 ss-3]